MCFPDLWLMTFALSCLFPHVTYYCLVTGNLLVCGQEVPRFGMPDVLQMTYRNGHSDQGHISLLWDSASSASRTLAYQVLQLFFPS